jgi:hypothetical protein
MTLAVGLGLGLAATGPDWQLAASIGKATSARLTEVRRGARMASCSKLYPLRNWLVTLIRF